MTDGGAVDRSAVDPGDGVTQRLPAVGRQPAPPPPARPSVEFRERPSVVLSRRPRVVSQSVALWTAAGALAAVGALLMLLDLDGLLAAVHAAVDRSVPLEQAPTRDRVALVATIVLVAGGAVGLLEVVTAGLLRSGRASARFALVLLLVLAVVEVVLAVGVVGLPTRLVLLLGTACGVVGAVFMYLPAANLWFGARHR